MTTGDDDTVLKSSVSVVTLPLGSRAQLTQLFSYPNHPSHNCLTDIVNLNDNNRQEGLDKEQEKPVTMSLEETIQHYLETSMIRDGHVDSKIQISTEHDCNDDGDSLLLYATISGNAVMSYFRAIPEFLNIGKLGLQACQQIQADGLWRDNWRFFLPLGLPLAQHWTVELLHFPPIYTLEEDQDYLASRSTQRWRQLLQINSCSDDPQSTLAGITNPQTRNPNEDHHNIEPTDRFQAIIDIVPIAAPSSDGKSMKDVYPYFEEYIRASLQFWVSRSSDQVLHVQDCKPIIAFGWPVKCWVETNQAPEGQYNKNQASTTMAEMNEEESPSDLLKLGVLSLTRLPIGSENDPSSSAPVLVANHPSYLYNAGRRMGANRMESLGDDDSALLERIMTEDLIAARWQVGMGLDQSQDAHNVFQECCRFWRDPSRIDQIHQLINQQAFILQGL